MNKSEMKGYTMDRLNINIDVTDWLQEVMQNEMVITSDDDIIALLESGEPTSTVTRAAIINRTIGNAPFDLMRSDKLLLYTGAMQDIISKTKRRKVTFENKDGKTYTANAYIGRVAEKSENGDGEESEDFEPSYVRSDSKEGLERAQHYLDKVVMGYIFERLKQIYMNGGDVVEAAQNLSRAILLKAGELNGGL